MSNTNNPGLMKDIDPNRVVKLINSLNTLISAMMVVHQYAGDAEPVPEETATLVTDFERLLDFHLYEVLKATTETAPSLVDLLLYLAEQLRQRGDLFYAGFFFALGHLLDLRLATQGSENDRREFERSVKQTVEKYGLARAGHAKEKLRESNRKIQPARYVA